MVAEETARYLEYREHVARQLLGPALRDAVLIFILLQTFVFVPADYLLYRENFGFFLSARLALNLALCVIWFGTALRWPGPSSVAVCALGTALFMSMVSDTGGVASGYYVGLILLVVGMGFLTPQSFGQAIFISIMIFGSYAALPFFTRDPIDWLMFSEKLFFLGAACAEACWACLHMDRMRFADFRQKRQLEKARDELADLDRAKSRFSANVHHELRTPLTLILAPLDALRDGEFGPLDPAIQSTVATMQANGRRLHKMINNLLDLSKVESNQFEIVRRKVRLAPIVEELVVGARALAERKKISIESSGFETLPEIFADAEAIEKVFVNLVGNALKFTDKGGLIRVMSEVVDGGLKVSVVDNGIGISPNKLASIFDRFAQVDSSATRRYEGTGIGLSLAQEMVELHGGKIWAESEGEGRGTTLVFTLPIGEPDADIEEEALKDDEGKAKGIAQSIAAVEADLQIGTDLSKEDALLELKRTVERFSDQERTEGSTEVDADPRLDAPEILIAEDNPDMRALLALLIGKEFRVRLARNGREALESLKMASCDLVLSDVMMPEMSGIELCRAIRCDRELASIPIVLVTSKAEREMKIEGLELGADDYVTKPFHPRELLARVRSLVRVASLQRQLAVRNRSLEDALDGLQQAEVQLVQSERLAAVGELAAGVAHEINNPVNFAINAARGIDSTVKEIRTLLDELGDVDLRARENRPSSQNGHSDRDSSSFEVISELAETLIEYSEIVREGLGRTSVLVGSLRDFASPGRSNDMSSSVNLVSGILSTVQLIRHAVEAAGVQIELSVDDRLPEIVGNPGRINQMFLNLIKNAAEACEGRGGTIKICLKQIENWIEVEISDDGRGISPEDQSRLFEPFFSTKAVGRGTGLGLSISRQIVFAHGGAIDVRSEVNRGTCFTVRLPILDGGTK